MKYTYKEDKHIIDFAYKAHMGQFRRDGITPYWNHIEAVMDRTETREGILVAVLHDTVEDNRATWEEIKSLNLSKDVFEALVLLTHQPEDSYRQYLDKISVNPLAREVKIADMLANLSESPTDKQIVKYASGLLFLMQYTVH